MEKEHPLHDHPNAASVLPPTQVARRATDSAGLDTIPILISPNVRGIQPVGPRDVCRRAKIPVVLVQGEASKMRRRRRFRPIIRKLEESF